MRQFYFILFLLPSLLIGQNITIAADDADNYDPPAWDTNNNQGTGFGPWAFDENIPSGGQAGRFIGSFSTALDVNSKSFGLFANSATSTSYGATRPFLKALEQGDTFTVSVGVNFRDGAKGFNLRDANNVSVVNFNTGNNAYNLEGIALFNGSYDANTVFTFTFTQNENDISWVVVRSGGQSDTQSGTLPNKPAGTITNIRFYNSSAGNEGDGGGARNLYFNSLEMTSPFALPPSSNASNLSFTSVEATSMNINWTNGDGANRIVVLREANAVDFVPSSGTNYVANNDFSAGTGLGPSTDNKVIYNGSGSTVNVTGLSFNTTYHVAIFEYNGSGGSTESYLTNNELTGSQITSDAYFTIAPGDYDNISTWELNSVPPLGSKVEIQHDVTLNQNATVLSMTINSGSTLTSEAGQGRIITIQNAGTFTNDGTFTANDGAVSFAGSGTISGTTTFNNVDIAGGVDFGSASTIGGTLTINAGGFANANGPIYGASSTLEFATGGSYDITGGNLLWGTGNAVGQSVPNNVLVSSTNPLNIFEIRDVTGNLTINSGASVVQGNNSFIIQGNFENSGTYSFVVDGESPLTVQGNFVNNSGANFSLSTDNTGGGDLIVQGNFDDSGTFTSNNRAVFFTGGNAQTVTSSTDPLVIDFLLIDKSANDVTMNQNLDLPNDLTLTNGNLDLNGNTLTISGDIIPTNGSVIANGPGSTLIYDSASAQTIESGDLQGDEVTNLSIDATGGVTVNTALNVTTDLTVNSVGILTVDKAASLEVGGNFNVDGTLTLESDSNEYSSLIVVDTTPTGDVTYNRHVNDFDDTNATTAENSNDLVSPPTAIANVATFLSGNANLLSQAGTPTVYAFAPFNNNSGAYENLDSDDTGALIADTGTTLYTRGTGFRAATSSAGQTLEFTGTVATTTVTKTITIGSANDGTEAWNLIGNPFPSYLDFDAFFTENKSEFEAPSFEAIYGYNATAARWTIWNQATIDDTSETEYIAPGQGFFVKSKTGGGTVSFTPAMRTTAGSDDFILGRSANSVSVARTDINLESDGKDFNTIIYFNSNATRGMDPGYDASAYLGNANGIFTQLVEGNTGIELAIQTLAYNDYNDVVVPVGVKANQGQQITFGLGTNTLPEGTKVYLDDTVANTVTELTLTDYIVTPANELNGTGRFFLRFESNALSNPEVALDGLSIFTENKTIVVAGQLDTATTARVYDLQGRLVITQDLNTSLVQQRIEASALSTGIYIVELSDAMATKTQKVIVR
jgi:hypothetical protein